jgi:kinesin family member 15
MKFRSFSFLSFPVLVFLSTIFAYGQTGSGKTHTMFGPPNAGNFDRVHFDGSPVGLIPRAIQEIFLLSQHPEVLQFSVLCSFVQLYNENCYDMLRSVCQ